MNEKNPYWLEEEIVSVLSIKKGEKLTQMDISKELKSKGLVYSEGLLGPILNKLRFTGIINGGKKYEKERKAAVWRYSV